MADQSLVESKIQASKDLSRKLIEGGFPLVASYWDWRDERGGWVLFLVTRSFSDERKLIEGVSSLRTTEPYRSVFSLGDVIVDSRQIRRAEALASYLRLPMDLGQRIDTTFTGHEYFESAVPIYFAPELATRRHAAQVG